MLWTAAFWKGAGERALKTFLEVFVPTTIVALGATAEGVLDAWTAPWLVALQTGTGLALGATAISVLVSLGNADFVAGGAVDPRFVPHTTYTTLPDGTVLESQYGHPVASDDDVATDITPK
jgi:hypothetical protein